MDIVTFSDKVSRAAIALRAVCPFGEPSEEQVRKVVRDVGLPLSHEEDTFVVDPIRMTTVVNAYGVGGTGKMTEMTHRAWQYWHSLPKQPLPAVPLSDEENAYIATHGLAKF